jgi:hypothetical protein
MCSIKHFIVDPIVAEAYAALKAVELCRDLRLCNILLEKDTLDIVNVLLSDGHFWSRYSHLIDDTKFLFLRGMARLTEEQIWLLIV